MKLRGKNIGQISDNVGAIPCPKHVKQMVCQSKQCLSRSRKLEKAKESKVGLFKSRTCLRGLNRHEIFRESQ